MKLSSSRQMVVVCLSRLLLLLQLVVLPLVASAEGTPPPPIQFCKQDDVLSLDFCVAVTPYQNATSSSTDLYITITRNRSSTDGWLGIGLGPAMTGALMFLLYDDPQNPNSAMVTSVRTAKGHHQPTELGAADFSEGQAFPDIRIVRSSYGDGATDPPRTPGSPPKTRTGTSQILIYSSPLWPKTTIDPSSPSQPWIWAHNPTSPISIGDGTIQLHPHDPQHGFGFFWTDFKSAAAAASSSQAPPSFPTSDSSSGLLHLTTTTPPPIYGLGGPTIRNWMFHLHGLLTSLAFLLLYPLGALLLRTSDPRAFNFHWTTQAFASVLLVLGATLGWVLSRKIELVHQLVGLAIVGAVGVQLLLGWRHHVRFLRTKRSGGSWMAKGHVWIGRMLMGLGWVNVLLGLCARGYSGFTVLAVACAVLVEGVFMLRVLGFRKELIGFPGLLGKQSFLRHARRPFREESGGVGGGLGEEHFELVGDDDDEEQEDEDYDEDGRLKADVEWEERMREGGGGGGGGRVTGESENERARKLKRLNIV
jgi:Cytochrome domain of cellobiose dehydrogenase/Eukaryotic cytochrome b561